MKKTSMPHQEVQVQVTHSIPPQKIEMIKSLDNWVEDKNLIHLKPTEKSCAWTVEENKHGDQLNKYIYLSGRVDMRQIEKKIQYLISGNDGNLFNHFSIVVQRLGVYTTKDYTDILEFLVDRWKVKDLTGLSAEGQKAQEFVCELPSRLRKLEEKAQLAAKRAPTIPFSWIP
ncbi:hypothetical protein V6N12_009537, partial [Hibiscus sabdariffa]